MIDFTEFPDVTLRCTDKTVSIDVRNHSSHTAEIADGDVNGAILDVLAVSGVFRASAWIRSAMRMIPQAPANFSLRMWMEDGTPRYEYKRGATSESGNAPTTALDLVTIVRGE